MAGEHIEPLGPSLHSEVFIDATILDFNCSLTPVHKDGGGLSSGSISPGLV